VTEFQQRALVLLAGFQLSEIGAHSEIPISEILNRPHKLPI